MAVVGTVWAVKSLNAEFHREGRENKPGRPHEIIIFSLIRKGLRVLLCEKRRPIAANLKSTQDLPATFDPEKQGVHLMAEKHGLLASGASSRA